jgi:hypothetical protein
MRCLLALFLATMSAGAQVNVLTQRGDNQRTAEQKRSLRAPMYARTSESCGRSSQIQR